MKKLKAIIIISSSEQGEICKSSFEQDVEISITDGDISDVISGALKNLKDESYGNHFKRLICEFHENASDEELKEYNC